MHIPKRGSFPIVDGPLSSQVAKPEPSPLGGVRTRLARLLAAVDARRRDRRAAAELAALDDRLLADIGLRRTDVPDTRRSPWPAEPWRRVVGRGAR